jgi:pyruvate/2-oxoglutarate dehydrogenase complex dihydrolipoamide dehydrogenase (E3) component
MADVRIRVVELMDHVLSAFDRQIGEFTAQQFKRSGATTCALPLTPA